MSDSVEISIKTSFLDRVRLLTINQDYIEFDDKDLISNKPIKFLKKEVTAFRYGVKWITGYQFTIGRIYCIDIKSTNDEIIKIRFKSIYGVNKNLLFEKYRQIIHELYNQYFVDISLSYLELFNCGQQFQIQNLTFSASGLSFKNDKAIIAWDDVGTKAYNTYYSIFSKSNPKNYKAFEYLSDWNTGIIYSVSRQILQNKGLQCE